MSNTIQRAFCWNQANHSRKLFSANGIKAMDHILLHSRSEEGTPKSNTRNTIQRAFCWQYSTILTESKPAVQQRLVCSKWRESTAQSKGATRFNNTSVDVQQIVVTNTRNGKLLQADMRNKFRYEKATLCDRLLKAFSKSSAHESRRIPVSNLKTLSG